VKSPLHWFMGAVTSQVNGLLEEVWRVLFEGGRLRSEGMGREGVRGQWKRGRQA